MTIEQRLIDLQNNLNSVDVGSLAREELGSNFDFVEAVPVILKILKDFNDLLASFDLFDLPAEEVDYIYSIADGLVKCIEQIRNFNIDTGDIASFRQQRVDIIARAKRLLEDDKKYFQPLLRESKLLRLSPDILTDQVANAVKSAREIERARAEAWATKEDVKQQIERSVQEVKDKLASGGASISQDNFAKRALEHKKKAKWWFIASIIAIALGAGLFIWLFNPNRIVSTFSKPEFKGNYPLIIQFTIYKLFILSIIYLVIYQCIKNFRTNKHLQTSNQHRQESLVAYIFLQNSTEDIETKAAISRQAAKAIFDPGTTGYLDSSDSPMPINLTEIINKMADKGQ